jgi:hypothetical protein
MGLPGGDIFLASFLGNARIVHRYNLASNHKWPMAHLSEENSLTERWRGLARLLDADRRAPAPAGSATRNGTPPCTGCSASWL